MSEAVAEIPASVSTRSFVAHAKLIGGLTLVSRILGLARESVSAHYFGAGLVSVTEGAVLTLG